MKPPANPLEGQLLLAKIYNASPDDFVYVQDQFLCKRCHQLYPSCDMFNHTRMHSVRGDYNET